MLYTGAGLLSYYGLGFISTNPFCFSAWSWLEGLDLGDCLLDLFQRNEELGTVWEPEWDWGVLPLSVSQNLSHLAAISLMLKFFSTELFWFFSSITAGILVGGKSPLLLASGLCVFNLEVVWDVSSTINKQ